MDLTTRKSEMHFRKSMQIIFQDPVCLSQPRLTIEQTFVEPDDCPPDRKIQKGKT